MTTEQTLIACRNRAFEEAALARMKGDRKAAKSYRKRGLDLEHERQLIVKGGR